MDRHGVEVLAVLYVAQALHIGPAVTMLATRLATFAAATLEAYIVLRELRQREIVNAIRHNCE